MLIELIRDNIEVIHVIDESDVDQIIGHLKKNKNPKFLQFLSVLCVCNETPVHSHQHSIAKKLLVGDAAKGALFKTKFEKEKKEVFVNTSEGYVALSKFVAINSFVLSSI